MGHLVLGAIQLLVAVQALQATITGTVLDAETHRPLAGAVVMLTDLGRVAATDSTGRYELTLVPAGPQHLVVRGLGYHERSMHALVPREGALEINVALTPAPIPLPAHEVRGRVVIRGLEGAGARGFPDREMSMAAVRNHPLLGEPDAIQALDGGEVVMDPETPSGASIRGAATDQTGYALDGIPVLNPYHAAGLASAWNPDALAGVRVASTAPSLAVPHALGGAIEAVTRDPGSRLGVQGALTTTQARLTLDGPIGAGGAGYVVSTRSGLHDAIAPSDEPSYVRAGNGDWLAKLESPVGGGRARLLAYGNDNEVEAANRATLDADSTMPSRRNELEWYARSFGAEWRREAASTRVRVAAWSASGFEHADWAPSTAFVMDADRRDVGASASWERRAGRAAGVVELRVERSRTSYRVDADSTASRFEMFAATPVATLIVRPSVTLMRGLDAGLGGTLAAAVPGAFFGPEASVRWSAWRPITLTASVARTHQFTQSLRNAESVVGNVFPVDLSIGAGAPGVPVARSDLGVIGADWHPAPGLRAGVQAYARDANGLLLVAPRDGGPFTRGGFTVGSSTARGIAADIAFSSARFAFVASYGFLRARVAYADSSYVPAQAASHRLEGGVTVFPVAAASFRVGAVTEWGRRATAIPGTFEWESCNLLDQGCEFAGSPDIDGQALGAATLPVYSRVDASFRVHRHFGASGGAVVALFGTATNVLGWKNVLTYTRDPVTGRPAAIEMRPQSPLVVGIDWRF
jgi:CarboxypepD_reg-like domain